MRWVHYLIFLLITGCSLDASITDMNVISPPVVNLKGESPEFHQGEIVTTDNGIIVKGFFGEISESYVTENGIEITGAFYE